MRAKVLERKRLKRKRYKVRESESLRERERVGDKVNEGKGSFDCFI